MYILQLLHLKGMSPATDQTSDDIQNDLQVPDQKTINQENNFNDKSVQKIKSQLKNTNQIKTNLAQRPKLETKKDTNHKINSFEDIINLTNKDNEIELKFDLERNVKVVSFKKGKIDISFNDQLNKNFIKLLTEKLHSWTGERWIISLSKEIGDKTIFEKKLELKTKKIDEAKKDKKIKLFLETFNDAKLINVDEEDY